MNFSYSSALLFSRVMFILMVPSMLGGMYCCLMDKVYLFEWSVLNLGGAELFIPFILDRDGLIFSSAVLFISGNVINFANYYMDGEVFMKRFIYLVVLFVMSMNFLIYIPHMIGLLLGWDGLGLVSFVLVIYYQNSKSLGAGMITALSNRVGDVLILLSIGWTVNQGHWQVMNMWDFTFSSIIVFLIMVAGMTKSAQIPFSSWLPAAMAAPTPVSALVHSSTLVTAGVFLMIRFYPFLSSVTGFNEAILIISSLTMFMAGMSAIMETDMKKIIALSTLSQLGVMLAAIGLGLPGLAFFHLVTHALFKALLFVCAGTLINLHHHGQDLRSMGNLVSQMPLTMSCLNIANMALCGLPFLSGFYSKDFIIEISLYNSYSYVILMLFIFATMMTAAYSIRLTFSCVLSMSLGLSMQYISDESTDNTWPMVLLSLGAIFGGSVINWMMFSPMVEPVLSFSMKMLAFFVTLSGGLVMWFVVSMMGSLSYSFKLVHDGGAFMWFMVPMSTQMAIFVPFHVGKNSLKVMDQGWVESLGAQGIFHVVAKALKNYQVWQASFVTMHLSIMVFFIFFLLVF